MARTEPPRVAIVGAGPIGLEAALYAAALKLPATIYERGQVGEHLRRWGHVRMFTPFAMNTTPLGRAAIREEQPRREFAGEADILTGREHVAAYLEPLAATAALRGRIKAETTVLQIGKRGLLKEEALAESRRGLAPFRLLLRGKDGRERVEEADVVLDCSGTYAQPRNLGDGGIAAVGEQAARNQVAWGLEDIAGERRSAYADRTTLVLGAGHSAATSVCLLAGLAEKHPGTWVVWLARGGGTQPLRRSLNDPLRERDQLCARANMLATRGDGAVEFHAHATLETMESSGGPDVGFKIHARCAGVDRRWSVDRVIANVGYTPDRSLYRELQVQECFATFGPALLAAARLKQGASDSLSATGTGPSGLRTAEPNFYILGAKSFGRLPHFFLRHGFEQVRDVFTLIAGKADLDLYKKR